MSVTVKDAVTEAKTPADQTKTSEPDRATDDGITVGPRDDNTSDDTLALADPRDLLIRKAMPFKRHVVTRADGKKVAILLQGLSYLEKQRLDNRSRARRVQDEEAVKNGEMDEPRPSMWGPEIVCTAMCKPDGRRVYKEEEIRTISRQWAEQLADGEIQAAVNAVLDVSGWGEESAMMAGKSSKRTKTIAS